MSSTLGHILRLTSFGESHGEAIGVVLDGLPSGLTIDKEFIQKELSRRRPGQSAISTPRNETDEFNILSGVFEGRSTGAPICLVIPNRDQRSGDYEHLKNVYRPGHADRVYDLKYGFRDHRGGGRSSARITAGWVAAGAIARLYIQKVAPSVHIQSVVSRVHELAVKNVFSMDWFMAERNPIRCPDSQLAEKITRLIEKTKKEGDSLGGIISTRVSNCPPALGEPVFDKINADLAKAMFSINAVKGIEFGEGFHSAQMKGSEYNDTIDKVTNHDGGITGGITNGFNLNFNVAFKPVSSIAKKQYMTNAQKEILHLAIEGRHDTCVLPRAVPIVEAMTSLILADHLIMNQKFKL